VRNGLPVLHWNPRGQPVEAQMFVSPHLPSRWKDLDSFEGSPYKRRLITAFWKHDFRCGNGARLPTNIAHEERLALERGLAA
jgi:hypothetical protein